MGIDEYVLEKRQIINDELVRILSSLNLEGGDELIECAKYTILAPSNRWRPIVAIASAEMYDILIDKILPISCAIEMLHCASMMIDDLPSFDNAMLRRGKPTLHRVYGEGLAIYTSHLTLTLARSLIFRSDLPQQIKVKLVVDYFSDLIITEMIPGQLRDITSKNTTMTSEQILQMYEQKSGALYGFSAAVGGIVDQANNAEVEHLTKYGRKMGTAYQILDDILDIEAKPEEIGKDVGKDIGKPTLPSIIGVEASREKARELMQESKDALSNIRRNTRILYKLVGYIALADKRVSPSIVQFQK